MKYKFFRFSLLGIFAMLWGTATGELVYTENFKGENVLNYVTRPTSGELSINRDEVEIPSELIGESNSDRITVAKQLDGTTVTSGVGTVDVNVNGTTVELTITPDEGNYFETSDLTIRKYINAGQAQARRRSAPTAPDYDENVNVTADDGNTLTGASKFTFTLDDDTNILYVVTANFHTRTSIASATVTVASGTYTYNGKEHKPDVNVTLFNTTLNGDSDYTVEYTNNINAGDATVKITGIGKFTGTKENATFTIAPKSAEGLTITLGGDGFNTENNSFVYSGAIQAPTVTVTDTDILDGSGNPKVLVAGTDYTLTNEGGAEVADYPVKIVGKGNYKEDTGTETKFSITQKPLTKDDIEVTLPEEASNYTYDGMAKEPAVSRVTVTGVDLILLEDTDYELSYENNTDAGDANIVITLKKNFSGELKYAFTINKADMSIATISDIDDQEYTSEEIKPSNFTVTIQNGTITVDKSQYTVSYENNVEPSTTGNAAKVIITGTDKNFKAGTTQTKEFNIVAAPITITAPDQSVVYNGAAQEYTAASASNDKATLKVTYYATEADRTKGGDGIEAPTEAGDYFVTVTSDSPRFIAEPAFAKFSITQAGGSIRFASATVSKTYGDDPFTNALTIVGDGTVSYTSDNSAVAVVDAETGEVTIVGAGTATITAFINIGDNYSYAVKSVSFTLTVAVRAFAQEMLIRILPQIYNGQPQEPGLEVVDPDTHFLLQQDVDYTVVYSNNVNAGEATVTITGIGNYKGTATATFIIQKATSNLYFEQSYLQKTMGDADFVCEPQGAGDGTVTYWSDDESIATVDSATGLVSIKSVGIVKIYAKVSGTDNYEFINDEDWYELEVLAKIATALKPTTATATGVWYTLDGQRLNKKPTRKGVYILNGKKVVIK